MYKRIAIIGAPGTGKTTLANNLSKLIDIDATHIDGIHHLPNWETRDKKERDSIILEKIKEKEWIIDGTYHDTLRERLENADLVIWLDFSSIGILRGVLERYFKNKGKEKEEIPGCKEKMDKTFLNYCLKYNSTKRSVIVEEISKIEKDKVVVLKNRRAVNNWFDNFEIDNFES